ncbi:Protein of unknown function [Ruminococcaceae bacterium YRB3002]|nr:Protein of unknown function [Ruminococcaceae bacterium YRB3002]
MTVEEFCNPLKTPILVAMANQVIIDESPVSINTISQRILEACGITKSTPKIKERVDYLVRATRIKPAPDGTTLFFWKPGSDPMAYDMYRCSEDLDVRAPEDIHSSEAACAMLEAITEQYGIPPAEACAAGARKLGLTRMTPAVKELMESGLTILQDENAVTLNSRGMLEST